MAKEKKKEDKEQSQNPDAIEKTKASIQLLLGDKLGPDFKANTLDKRFEAIKNNKAFAMDPSNKDFKKAKDSAYLEASRKRQKTE